MWRNIKTCLSLIKEYDKGSQISLYFIRKLAQQKLVDTLVIGSKVLIDFNSLKKYLNIN